MLVRAKADGGYATDFVVSIENTEYREPPMRYRPGHMHRRHERLAKLWRHCIGLVLRANAEDFRYRVGFVLDPDKKAYFNGKDGLGELLINPDLFPSDKSPRERFYYCLQLAAHELAHRRYSYPDESFVRESERLLLPALMAMGTVHAELRAASKVVL